MWVFHDANDGDCPSTLLMQTLQAHGYTPFVDSLHRNDRDWLMTTFSSTPHRMIKLHPMPRSGRIEKSDLSDIPDLVLYYTEEVDLTDVDWDRICDYIVQLLQTAREGGVPHRPVWTRFMSKYLLPPQKPSPINSFPPVPPAPAIPM